MSASPMSLVVYRADAEKRTCIYDTMRLRASLIHNGPAISSPSVRNDGHTPASRVCLRSDMYENCSAGQLRTRIPLADKPG
jgi:hypothetical protein